jgi:hypothetical protein
MQLTNGNVHQAAFGMAYLGLSHSLKQASGCPLGIVIASKAAGAIFRLSP